MKRMSVFGAMLLLALSTAAQASDAIRNWAAPSSWTPPSAQAAGRSALVTYQPLPFVPLDPCRLIDTRSGTFPVGYGPPSMAGGGTQRSFTITGPCGIPVGAQAVSFNFAVWIPPTRGDLRVFPAGGATPTVSTLNWEAGILALANAAVVPLSAGGEITVQIDGSGTVDIFVDVNGYYTGSIASDQSFIVNSPGFYAIIGTGAKAGVWGQGGLFGVAGTSSMSAGVFGLGSGTAVGVEGTSPTNSGVRGTSSGAGIAGVLGQNSNDANGTHGVGGLAGGTGAVFGVQGQIGDTAGAGAAGVHGIGALTGAPTYGVLGESGTNFNDSAGVRGNDGGGGFAPVLVASAGVRGDSTNPNGIGVAGSSKFIGVFGGLANSGGFGYLAIGFAGTSLAGGPWGLFANGNVGASGTKPFVEVHPTDPNKLIRYVALEGPEAGTYFRGRARFSGGQSVIPVPESFRLVSAEEGLTVQITPIGDAASFAVVKAGLDEIVVMGSKDVEFYYMVNGTRETFKDWQVIVEDGYAPRGPDARLPAYFSPAQQRRLIANGTYNPDGTVNMGTAERLGWAEKWRESEARRKPASAE